MGFLEITHLSVSYAQTEVVSEVMCSLAEGETLGIAGESGCGKSTLARAILGILPKNARVSGSIKYRNQELVRLAERDFEALRGGEISMIFQNPSAALNPVRKLKHQFYDILGTRRLERKAADAEIIRLLSLVHLPEPEAMLERYPNQLSGGMKQRAVIAMAISKSPNLLIADEPTSALDAEIRLQIINELTALQKQLGFGMIFISHNLAELSRTADSVMIMKDGALVEYGRTAKLLSEPSAPYTRELIAAAK